MSKTKKIATLFNYKNITISGLPGSGSTTLLKMLKENDQLKFAGWSGFNGGDFMRSYAQEKGLFKENGGLHHSAEDYEDDFDRKVDFGMREKLENDSGWILESWLSGFMSQGVEGTLKVLMVCSDKAVKVDRIVNRDMVTPDEAIKNMHDRYVSNLNKWQRMYSDEWNNWLVKTGKVKQSDPIDFWREDIYDVVIDTYSANQKEVLKIVLDEITK
jgi:cytidylate kinase